MELRSCQLHFPQNNDGFLWFLFLSGKTADCFQLETGFLSVNRPSTDRVRFFAEMAISANNRTFLQINLQFPQINWRLPVIHGRLPQIVSLSTNQMLSQPESPSHWSDKTIFNWFVKPDCLKELKQKETIFVTTWVEGEVCLGSNKEGLGSEESSRRDTKKWPFQMMKWKWSGVSWHPPSVVLEWSRWN